MYFRCSAVGLSITTETTDISMSMCSLNSTTISQPDGEYANATATMPEPHTVK